MDSPLAAMPFPEPKALLSSSSNPMLADGDLVESSEACVSENGLKLLS